ncbi:uncharacterized protein V6R79_017629 [Siganus canaliculatus]
MWRYQKLGFESLLLAELQKQQQCNQFCDTLLKTEDVSVPAHSCVLSAISPSISSALSSAPPPPAGRRRLLEFQAFDSSTLLHIVRLLYSGEMVGEGEREKQEVISAAAKLGIHGLVEVAARGGRGRCEQREGSYAEVGVQTEPQMLEESEGREGRWRREVRGGSTFLWRERLTGGEQDSWTQTEEQQPNMAPPAPSGASYETIDIAALQSFGQTDPNLLSYIPMPLVYHLDENPPAQASSALVVSEPTTAGHTSVAEVEQPYPSTHLPTFSRHATTYEPQSWWPTGDVSATDEWEEDRIEQFEGNIPGFINHFLNPDTQEGSCRGRGRRKQRARGAQTGERKPRQPRAARGSRRGGLTQTVDVQDVGVSRLQKLFLQRGGRRVFMTGQGGGAVGRKLFMKTREILKSAKSSQRRRGRGKMWDFNQNVDLQAWRGGGAGAGSSQRSQSDVTTSRPRRPQAKATTTLSFSSPPTRIHSVHTMSASRPSLQASPAPSLHSPAASCVRPAPSLLRSNPVIPPAPPLPEEHPETFDRLLEEVMMGLDILPSTSKASYSQPAPRSSGSSSAAASCGNASAQKKQQGQTTGLQEGGQSSTQAVSVSRETGGSVSAASEGPVQRQQTRAELSDMLENFLLSFEQQVASEEAEINTDASSRRSRTPEQQQQQQRRDEVEPQRRCSQAGRPSAHRAGTEGKAATRSEPKKRKRRRTAQHLLSLEKKRNRVRSPAPLSGAVAKLLPGQGIKQLQQMPVVKLERNGLLPGSVKLTGHSCQRLEGENPAAAKTSSSCGEFPQGRKCTKTPTAWWTTKTYPIRSRFRQVNVDCQPFLEESLPQQRPTPATKASDNPDRPRKAGRPRKNTQVPIYSEGITSTVPIHPQPVVLSCSEEQPEESPERREQEVPEQAQEEAAQRGEKRGAEQEEALMDDDAVAKKVCFEPPPTSECADFASAAAEMENVIDVETVSLSSVAECLRGEDVKLAGAEFPPGDAGESSGGEELESSGSETIDVEEEEREDAGRDLSRAATQRSVDGDDEVDEVIDVIGGSSPAPDPVVICWTDTSEEETEAGNEDIDVGESADYDSASAFAARKAELMPTNYQTEVLLL